MTEPAPSARAGAERDAGSYRDPAGFVFRRDGVVYRQIAPSFADEWQAYLDSGLYERLRDEGIVIPHEKADLELAAVPPAHAVIRPGAQCGCRHGEVQL